MQGCHIGYMPKASVQQETQVCTRGSYNAILLAVAVRAGGKCWLAIQEHAAVCCRLQPPCCRMPGRALYHSNGHKRAIVQVESICACLRIAQRGHNQRVCGSPARKELCWKLPLTLGATYSCCPSALVTKIHLLALRLCLASLRAASCIGTSTVCKWPGLANTGLADRGMQQHCTWHMCGSATQRHRCPASLCRGICSLSPHLYRGLCDSMASASMSPKHSGAAPDSFGSPPLGSLLPEHDRGQRPSQTPSRSAAFATPQGLSPPPGSPLGSGCGSTPRCAHKSAAPAESNHHSIELMLVAWSSCLPGWRPDEQEVSSRACSCLQCASCS